MLRATRLLVALIAALAAVLLGPTASASAAGVAETRVGAISISVEPLVGPPEHVSAGQGRVATLQQPQIAVATGVAAETGGSGVLRHYTTREAAESISKEGVLRPGGSGKTWLTPDRYANGADARSGLALNKTPDGYYEIPMCRVRCPSGPSTVEPYYGQPGGGTEITTEFPIDVRDLVFNLFGG